MVGQLLAQGAIGAAGGMLSLFTAGYPVGEGVFTHVVYQIKQWFNIGCVLGPILVDIILLFCSGGSSGVFSLAAKAGKLGDAAKLARFATKLPKAFEATSLFRAAARKIPKALVERVSKLVHQLWAIVGKLSDQIGVLLKAVNDKLRRSGKAVPEADMTKIAARLDNWYDAAGAADVFAAVIYFLIGGTDAVVTPAAEVKPTGDGH